jgi:tetratricopeptide (TPR) repeat protein
VNETVDKRSVSPTLFRLIVLLLSLAIVSIASASGDNEQICDVSADYALGIEDYPEAIRLHAEVLRRHPDDALAHYHLGFAERMIGNRTAELNEYQRAAALGLRNWDLFLNLGLAQLEHGDLYAATNALRRAVLLGENHPESHYNLALVQERRGQFAEAEREMRASLRLNPAQPDALNALGVIYAEECKTERALLIWRELLREAPDYAPATRNLAVLSGQSPASRGETAAAPLPSATSVSALREQARAHSPRCEIDPRPSRSTGE